MLIIIFTIQMTLLAIYDAGISCTNEKKQEYGFSPYLGFNIIY